MLTNVEKGKFQNEKTLGKIIDNIGNKIEAIEKICLSFKENSDNFYDKNHYVQDEMDKLKYLVKKYKKEHKKVKDNLIKDNNINNINNINKKDKNVKVNDSVALSQSFLFKIKDRKNILDFYKTSNLFNIYEEVSIKTLKNPI